MSDSEYLSKTLKNMFKLTVTTVVVVTLYQSGLYLIRKHTKTLDKQKMESTGVPAPVFGKHKTGSDSNHGFKMDSLERERRIRLSMAKHEIEHFPGKFEELQKDYDFNKETYRIMFSHTER